MRPRKPLPSWPETSRSSKPSASNLIFPWVFWMNIPRAFAFLFDAAHTGQYGGTGRATDWDVARRAAVGRPYHFAGGLKVENVAAAVRIVRPYGIDVASGVESRPGNKRSRPASGVHSGSPPRRAEIESSSGDSRKSMSSILHSPKTAPDASAPTEAATFPNADGALFELSVPMKRRSRIRCFRPNSNTC